MKVVFVDTGRSRAASNVEAWRAQLGLEGADEVALVSWLPPKGALPVVDQMVFGPALDWRRREPRRPTVGLERREPLASPSSVWSLPRAHPRRLAAAAERRLRTADAAVERRLLPVMKRLPGGMTSPWELLSSTSPVARRIRRKAGVKSDGIATDFAIAVARSRNVAGLIGWADLVVPIDPKSRKAAWILARRVPGPEVTVDLNSATRIVRALHARGV